MISIELATADDFVPLANLWERSVRASHSFITNEHIMEIKNVIQFHYFPKVPVYKAVKEGVTLGFMAVEENRLELLFLDDTAVGMGVGKFLIQHAINEFGVDELDVLEQNTHALGFYEHNKFKTCSRMEKDRHGFPYPLLTMKLQKD